MSDRIANLIAFLKDNGYFGMQTFFTRNIMHDPMENIYDEDDVQVDLCYPYCYLEIFGLTSEEQRELYDLMPDSF